MNLPSPSNAPCALHLTHIFPTKIRFLVQQLPSGRLCWKDKKHSVRETERISPVSSHNSMNLNILSKERGLQLPAFKAPNLQMLLWVKSIFESTFYFYVGENGELLWTLRNIPKCEKKILVGMRLFFSSTIWRERNKQRESRICRSKRFY